MVLEDLENLDWYVWRKKEQLKDLEAAWAPSPATTALEVSTPHVFSLSGLCSSLQPDLIFLFKQPPELRPASSAMDTD